LQITWSVLIFLISVSADVFSQDQVSHLAKDSLSSGRIKAYAKKSIEQSEVCFEVTLEISTGSREFILPKNWTMAWVNDKNQYRLLSLNQRDPASGPIGGNIAGKSGDRIPWTNSFKTCAYLPENDQVRGIVLTPKEMPFDYERNINLNWDL
jgi:hypothetical protein